MKRIFLVLCLLISMTYSSYAFQPDTNRWYWVASNKLHSVYVDTKTLKYDIDTDTATLYILKTTPQNQTYAIIPITLYFFNKSIFVGDSNIYSKNTDERIAHTPSEGTSAIIPMTLGERLYDAVGPLVGRDQRQAYLEDIKKNPGHIAY